MGNFIIFLVFLVNFSLVQPLSLTRELAPVIAFDKKINVQPFSEILDAISKTNILDDILNSLLENQNQTILNLVELLQNNSSDIPSIIKILNEGFEANILNVEDKNIKVVVPEVEMFLTKQVKEFSKQLFPKNPLQQITLYGVIIQQLKAAINSSSSELNDISIPFDDISKALILLPQGSHSVAKRDTTSDLITTIVTLFKSQICTVVTQVYSNANTILSSFVRNLSNAVVDTSSITNGALLIIANLQNAILSLAQELIEFGMEFIKTTYSSLKCSSSSRKRRDVLETNELTIANQQELVSHRSVSILLSLVGTVIAFIYKYTLGAILASIFKSWVLQVVTSIQTDVDKFFVAAETWIYSLINNITLSST